VAASLRPASRLAAVLGPLGAFVGLFCNLDAAQKLGAISAEI
jgi:hypothetical protein